MSSGINEVTTVATQSLPRRLMRNLKKSLARPIAGLLLITCFLPAGCSTYVGVEELDLIQDEAGFYPKVVYYCGSNDTCHFFQQETPMADLTLLSKRVRSFIIVRRELHLPEGAEFEHWTYRGKNDPRRQRMRIRIASADPPRGWAAYPVSDFGQR